MSILVTAVLIVCFLAFMFWLAADSGVRREDRIRVVVSFLCKLALLCALTYGFWFILFA